MTMGLPWVALIVLPVSANVDGSKLWPNHTSPDDGTSPVTVFVTGSGDGPITPDALSAPYPIATMRISPARIATGLVDEPSVGAAIPAGGSGVGPRACGESMRPDS